MLVYLRRWARLLKHLIILAIFCSSGGDCDDLALHASEEASISSLISSPHAKVDSFSDSENVSRHLTWCQLTPAAFVRANTMLTNEQVQLFSENILAVPDNLDQHKLQPKKAALDDKVVSVRTMA